MYIRFSNLVADDERQGGSRAREHAPSFDSIIKLPGYIRSTEN